MTTKTPTEGISIKTKACVVIVTLLAGLALAPGYLLLCGHSSGRLVGRYDLYTAATDGNSVQSASVSVQLTKDMGAIGFNVVIATPFRDHDKAELAKFHTALSTDGKELWTSDFSLGHGQKREAIPGTTFTVRVRSFRVAQDGACIFKIDSDPALQNIRSLSLEVRRGVLLPKRWVVGLGLLIIAAVMVWAIIPAKGYDPKAERIGTKWYED